MPDFVIIPDTSCDLTEELRNRFDIPDYVKGVIYFPDGHSERSDLDYKDMTSSDFFKSMSDKKSLYKTASPVLGEVIEVFEKHLAEGKDVLSVSLSSALSGTIQVCEAAKKELMEKYPDRKIICVDSLRYSTSLSLLVMMASVKRKEGATIEETAAYIEEKRHTIHQMGPMDDLFFLVKTGRISNFKAFFGTLAGINPMADFNRNGLSEVLAKFKGKKSALSATIEYMKKTIVNPQEQIIFVAHSDREAAANTLAEMIKAEFNPKEIIISPVGMACGASIGPGLCAAFYQGTEISQDNTHEKAIMAEITEQEKNRK